VGRELVSARLAEAEAAKKLRAASRVEAELTARVAQRDERIFGLKDQLAAASRARDLAKKRSVEAERQLNAGMVVQPSASSRAPAEASPPQPVLQPAAAPAVTPVATRPSSRHGVREGDPGGYTDN
jgi:hypothetical protein